MTPSDIDQEEDLWIQDQSTTENEPGWCLWLFVLVPVFAYDCVTGLRRWLGGSVRG